ncbi:SDR family oxidoreductase [Candidatus Berkelbacteria bacterium]|nr:SDR family oxidoreductase [Candidatus Berkelbacteria bacterium]
MAKRQKVAVVFGASEGIGRATALLFAQMQWQVIACARSADKLEEMRAKNTNIVAVPTDITVEKQVAAAFEKALGLGEISAIITTPSTYVHSTSLEQIDLNRFRKDGELNRIGVATVVKHAAGILKSQRSGVFVLLSSLGGLNGWVLAGNGAYSFDKSGQTALAEALHRELSEIEGNKARSYALCPGLVLTGLVEQRLIQNPHERQNGITAEEAAEAVTALIERPSKYDGFIYRLEGVKLVKHI